MTDQTNPILAIISHSPLSGQHLYEALAALMVLATYGQAVQLMFVGDAVQSLQQLPNPTPQPSEKFTPAFKSVQAMIESFEFYDLLPVWIADQPLPMQPLVECVVISLNQLNLQQFKAVLTW